MRRINRFINKIVERDIWVFLTLFLFMSYLILQRGLNQSVFLYLRIFIGICILMSPILIFTWLKIGLKSKLPKLIYYCLWIVVFLILPFLLFAMKKDLVNVIIPLKYLNNLIKVDPLFKTLILSTLATEGVLTASKVISQKDYFSLFSRNFITQKWITVLLLFVSTLFSIALIWKNEDQYVTEQGAQIASIIVDGFFFVIQFFFILIIYLGFYLLNQRFLIPQIFKRRGLIVYLFGVAASILIFYPIAIILIKSLPLIDIIRISNFTDFGIFAGDGGFIPFLIMLGTLPFIISNEWYKQSKVVVELEKQKTEDELTMLKQQINPHFFFNTLNNLYALSITKDEQTPEVILKLSELMRYVIYRAQKARISLEEEIKYINDYISLELLRLEHKIDFEFLIDHVVKEEKGPPLLFITLVENAFKHGLNSDDDDNFLKLKFSKDGEFLVFSCINSYQKVENTDGEGIGLKNLKRRLELLYEDEFQLNINENRDVFSVDLKIPVYE